MTNWQFITIIGAFILSFFGFILTILGTARATQASLQASLTEQFTAFRNEMRAELGRVESGLKAELGRVESGLKAELGRVESGLKAELASVRSELASLRSELKSEIETLRNEMRQNDKRYEERFARIEADIREIKNDLRQVFKPVLPG